MRLHNLILVSVILLVAQTTGLAAQVERSGGGGAVTHTIRGRVFLPSGAPVDVQVRVTLRTVNLNVVSEGFTDAAGNFEFRFVPNGNYEVVCRESDRYEMTAERVEVFGRASRTFTQNLFLREKVKTVAANAPGATVTVAEYSERIPKEAKKEYEQGVKESKRHNYQKAIAHFKRALQAHPHYLQAVNDLGVQYLKLNQPTEALAAFQRAIEIEPRTPHPYINIGYIRLQQKEFVKAAESLAKAVEMDGANWSAHMLYGVALTEIQEFEQAQRELERALSLGQPPENSVARLQLANLFLRQQKLAQALEQAEKYLSEVPNAADADQVRNMIKRVRAVLDAQRQARMP